MVYLIKSDGTAVRLTRNTGMLADSRNWKAPKGFSSTVEPGDIVVALLKHTNRQSLESFKDAVDIIYKLALAAGVILRL